MRNSTQVTGFDYRLKREVVQTMGTWRAEIKALEARKGYTKRIAGDLTAFDGSGVMQFEVYDKDEGDTVESESTLAEAAA